ncbi:MAG: radical SAM protein [Methylobacteriaceae bacterium]|nr:radical SAM protein [Methylobacteriaceae bacterium]
MKYDVIIPTRDGAAHISPLLNAYRELGIEPLYVVDLRSRDNTLELLASLGARVTTCEPTADFAEAGMVEHGARAASADWIWRIDDDEFPSRALVDWLNAAIVDATVVAACRRELHIIDGRYVYSRWPTRLSDAPKAVNYQYRIFRRDAVRYVQAVHTPGFDVPRDHFVLPGNLFTAHLNCIIHDVYFRLSKVRTYATYDERLSWSVVDECLPEYLDPVLQNYSDDGLEEFFDLLNLLGPPTQPSAPPPLADRERALIEPVVQRAYDALREQRKREIYRLFETRLTRAPKPLLRETSKLLCSLAGAKKDSPTRIWGEALWDFSKAPVAPQTAKRDGEEPKFRALANPPRFLFLSINKRCNLKCEHCVFWHDDDRDRASYLSREGRRRVMGELKELNPSASVVICGGESMLDLDDYFDVSRECRRLGLTCISVVNGTRIRSAEMAERMIAEGPHEISISLNSHRADLHDRTRGVPGAFEKATRALRLLRDARGRLGARKTKIYAMGLVFAENYRELPEFYDFVLNDLEVDKLKLNFVQPSFGGPDDDRFFAEQSAVDPDELVDIIRACDDRFSLGLNTTWLRQVRMYFSSISARENLTRGWASGVETREHLCNTYERNVMVDHYGVARLCFAADFRGEKLEKDGDLRRFWLGADDVREQMRTCNRLCGISHSVRNSSSTRAATRLTAAVAPIVVE